MKQLIKQISFVLLASALIAPATLLAQDKEDKDKSDKKNKKGGEQIVITRSADKDQKMVIEIVGDKITVNGKPIDEVKDTDMMIRIIKDASAYKFNVDEYGVGSSWNNSYGLFNSLEENRAMLGVTTEKDEKGVEVKTVSKESGAEKAGLKVKDVITKIDDEKIEDPDDLSKTIKAHKPGDKVSVTYLRDGKEQKVSAELGKYKGLVPMQSYRMPDMNFAMPRIHGQGQTLPRVRGQLYNNNWSWSEGAPRLGVSVQDTEDGKGVKVIDVEEDGNGAKAGIKENDIITDVDGKAVNSADEVAKVMKESKDKISVKMKVQRNGKTETLDVKIPRKLKTTDL